MATQTTSPGQRFVDRRDAGRRLAALIDRSVSGERVVLALPRGGVPVGFDVARALGAPLDVLVVRKLGVPGHEELAMGAIASGGVRVLNDDVLLLAGVRDEDLAEVTERERHELERREREYRGDRPPVSVTGRHAIVVDDGLATGATMRAAVTALRMRGPASITVAVPVGSQEALRAMREIADDVVCVMAPYWFRAVGEWYDDFGATEDDEVRTLLAQAAPPRQKPQAARVTSSDPLATLIARHAHPWRGETADFAPLAPLVRTARVVLIGESTHGTHEHYAERVRLTKWLIEEHGFTDVAAEADWPDAWRVHRFVRGEEEDADAEAALGDFERFPRWMWRNLVMRDFVSWLRAHDDALRPEDRVGFYGLDLYSLHRSMDAVVRYLDRVDRDAAARARDRYACFDAFGDDPQRYGYATGVRGADTCEAEVVEQLRELQARATTGARVGPFAADDRFFAEQNARLARNAEAYYRSMYRGAISSWNLRDRHMGETLDALLEHLSRRRGREARIVVWAHNSHLGDARATHMGWTGELNLGQLARERYGDRALLIGQTTHHGTVSAASDWGGEVERKRVRPGLEGSYEALLSSALGDGVGRALLVLRGGGELTQALRPQRLERAIGVIYRPESERRSHYFGARLADQFDVVLHLDETRALEPLDRIAGWDEEDAPETYPTGL
ncbi:erythromycin esterase family protein [Sandaracinus amylolyticus]|uniref:Putative L-isoaspartate O-methyltransferase n=1 Tax=Sandaracinus amylolyticus TaxID=927083 RepID=A0A0F6W051_9BACT|nr:erythromycin esterase family protein [Sandaracinus amylolyticus]AKF04061.1 Putative L-isoaspartate O-methyltransferase [Sandaracinus amylolyticus]